MIHLVCAANRDYRQHLCAMLASVILNTSEELGIHILNNDFVEEDREHITSVFQNYLTAEFYFYTVNDEAFSEINIIAEHLTIQTLYRLLSPILLPSTIDKVLYLDCDIIVEDNIAELYALDLEDHYLAATNELSSNLIELLELDDDTDYFNAGVILINLQKWREENFWGKCRDFALSHPDKLVYGDQDILNGVLRGNWKRFQLRWNALASYTHFRERYISYFGAEEVEQANSRPAIIHYIGASKPWHAFCRHPEQARYFYYLDYIQYPYVKYPELVFMRQQEQKKIVLFGASNAGASALNRFNEHRVEVSYFCDNSSDKWNTTFCDVKVISPSELLSLGDAFIFITSMYTKEIAQQLLGLDFIENQDFYDITVTWKLSQ